MSQEEVASLLSEIEHLKSQLAERDATIEQLKSYSEKPSGLSLFASSLANKQKPKTQALSTRSIKFLSNLVGNIITIHFPKNIETSP